MNLMLLGFQELGLPILGLFLLGLMVSETMMVFWISAMCPLMMDGLDIFGTLMSPLLCIYEG
jgi:hypothetical protein